jgi:hypothetical protein
MKRATPETKKVRSDAVMKNLPEERQAEILDHTKTHKLSDTVEWLAKGGLTVSTCAVSNWRIWRVQKIMLDRRQERILNLLADYKKRYPKTTKQELNDMGEDFFNRLAIDQEDVKSWQMAQQVQLKRERQEQQQQLVDNAKKKVDLQVRKYEGEAKTGKKKDKKTKWTPKQKETEVKQILGIS